MAALAMRLDDRPARLWRPAILILVAALHGALLLIAAHWQTRLDSRGEESLIFLPLPGHVQSPEETPPPAVAPHKKSSPAHDTQLVTIPVPVAPPPAEQPPANIDWSTEAALTAKLRAESAAAPRPRALDKHGAGTDFDGGLAPDQGMAPEFGWDHAHTHRVEALEGGGSLLWINDRCFIVMAGLIPFPLCGIGEIPVRGDLFDHMRDLPAQQPHPNNTAP